MERLPKGFWGVSGIAAATALVLLWKGLFTPSVPLTTSSSSDLNHLSLPAPPPISEARQLSPGGVPPREEHIVVHVAGAVKNPGVVRLPFGSRVDDAVKAAGGFTAEADPDSVNLAQPLEDGVQVYVPRRSEHAPAPRRVGGSSSHTAHSSGQEPGGNVASSQKINLNTATAEQLEGLPGIGPVTARAILEYRQQNGGFRSVDELIEVRGIGQKRLEQIRPYVVVR